MVKWSPAELPCAPRPINGELLSSWLRRVAAANDLTLPEIEACIGNRPGEEEGAAVPDFRPPKQWRLAVCALTRVPERWVWVLGLDQHFPAAGADWFVQEHRPPCGLGASFCPECFQEQIVTKKPLHLKAEWVLATTTRCFRHHLPLYQCCPWCGADDPVHFRGSDAIECTGPGQRCARISAVETDATSVGQVEARALGWPRMQVPAGCRNRRMAESRLHQVDGRTAV